MTERKVMRDLGLNEPVSITLPAYVWLGFSSAYISSDFNSTDANNLINAIQRSLLDPVFIKEQEAQQQFVQDQHQNMFHQMMTGRPPEIPPNMEA